jgi:hypothetical protein
VFPEEGRRIILQKIRGVHQRQMLRRKMQLKNMIQKTLLLALCVAFGLACSASSDPAATEDLTSTTTTIDGSADQADSDGSDSTDTDSGDGETTADDTGAGETTADDSGAGETTADDSGDGETTADDSGDGETTADASSGGTTGATDEACVPNCEGKDCGDNGCGESCGECEDGFSCDEDGQCICEPQCDGKICGPDGCGQSCGGCDDGLTCTDDGTECLCVPNCNGKNCGDDGCGGSCGLCDATVPSKSDVPEVCDAAAGQCTTDWCMGFEALCDTKLVLKCKFQILGYGPYCAESVTKKGMVDKDCWTMACAVELGLCPGNPDADSAIEACAYEKQWYFGENCEPQCAGKSCGDDQCGGECGACKSNEDCVDGNCQCFPKCDDKQCGDDSCGGSCGACDGTKICDISTAIGSQCVGEGDTCMAAFDITSLPFEITANTAGAKDYYNVAPGPGKTPVGEGSPEHVYRFVAPKGTAVYTVTLKPKYLALLYGRSKGPNTNLPCALTGGFSGDNLGTATETMTLKMNGNPESISPAAHFIFVDGSGTDKANSGEYTLTIEKTCTPNCDGKECGEDGCGYSCGSCQTWKTKKICFEGQCCKPVCEEGDCGSDGCGGVCPECGDAQICGFESCWDKTPNCKSKTGTLQCNECEYCGSGGICYPKKEYKDKCEKDSECVSGKCDDIQKKCYGLGWPTNPNQLLKYPKNCSDPNSKCGKCTECKGASKSCYSKGVPKTCMSKQCGSAFGTSCGQCPEGMSCQNNYCFAVE